MYYYYFQGLLEALWPRALQKTNATPASRTGDNKLSGTAAAAAAAGIYGRIRGLIFFETKRKTKMHVATAVLLDVVVVVYSPPCRVDIGGGAGAAATLFTAIAKNALLDINAKI